MNIKKNESIWYLKYTPQTVDDIIMPDSLKETIKSFITSNDIPHIGIFSNSPGTGKSSTVNAIINDIGGEAIWINASLENSIDVLRGKITAFASSDSLYDVPKIVVMDEADHFSQQGQAGLRGFLDSFSSNCRFLFTGNYKEKMIDPLIDRLEMFDFSEFKKQDMIKPIYFRLEEILKTENKEFKKEDVVKIINTYYPSIRSMIGALQKFSTSGVLIVNENLMDTASKFELVLHAIREKSFGGMIENVNSITAPTAFYVWLYKNINLYFEKEMLAKAIIILAKYQDMDYRAVDKNLNLGAACTELIMQCKIKGT